MKEALTKSQWLFNKCLWRKLLSDETGFRQSNIQTRQSKNDRTLEPVCFKTGQLMSLSKRPLQKKPLRYLIRQELILRKKVWLMKVYSLLESLSQTAKIKWKAMQLPSFESSQTVRCLYWSDLQIARLKVMCSKARWWGTLHLVMRPIKRSTRTS